MANQDYSNVSGVELEVSANEATLPVRDEGDAAFAVAQADTGEEPVPVDPASGEVVEAAPEADAEIIIPSQVSAGSDGFVRLPQGVSIDEIRVDGDNLVLVQPDGTTITILNAALRIPTFVIDDVVIPEVALTAALEANGINVAAGPDGGLSVVSEPQSSGANFGVAAPGIGDAGPVIDLLPPTGLQFGTLDEPELFPAAIQENDLPTLGITPLPGIVDESALDTQDAQGSGGGSSSTTGDIIVNPGNDGLGSLVVTNSNGDSVNVTGGGSIEGEYGTLIVTVGPGGQYSFEYVLSDNTIDHDGIGLVGADDVVTDEFNVILTDGNGDSVQSPITITITDDVPTAYADTNSVSEGASVSGNVLTDGTDDVFGADGPAATVPSGGVTGVASGSDTSSPVSGNVGVAIAGAYGTLTLNADGSYTYQSTADAISGDVTDTFVYTITDGDGDTSTVTLSIDVTDVTLSGVNQTKTVDEASLDLVQDGSDLAPGTVEGSNPSGTGETVTGSLNVAGAVSYTLDSGTDSYGTLQLNADGTYTYTLTRPFDTSPDADNGGQTETGAESYGYTATDANGNTVTGTITIDIVDDVPTAYADTNSVSEGASVSGNVLTDGTDDVFGADGPAATV
ncbi:cadherin-like domain-containing protein, partial [Rhizobiales bacterium]|uniref:beta strand repeat-containing protein n=1 Tax=Hongsoonwoonella zoysiae TaxID=2821844 RepID=UPI001560C499